MPAGQAADAVAFDADKLCCRQASVLIQNLSQRLVGQSGFHGITGKRDDVAYFVSVCELGDLATNNDSLTFRSTQRKQVKHLLALRAPRSHHAG